nr:expansin-like B1 [Ipomoea batatas]
MSSDGACGYGEYGRTTNDGQVCAVSTRLFKNGAGCGACYQVRCKSSGLCGEVGEKVMATDYVEGQETDFILSYRAYTGLAKQPRMAEFLREKGAVDVEFRRVSCNSAAKLRVKIHDNSQYPHYLSILLTNQGGATDIFAVEIYEEENYEWISMRRAFGAVWDLANPPSGELKARFLVSSSAAAKWVESEKAIIPAEWKAGLTIETNIKLN